MYNAKKLTKLLKKKQKYEGKVEKWMDALDREPSTPRPTVKIRKHWYHFRGEPVDAIDHYDKLILQLVVEVIWLSLSWLLNDFLYKYVALKSSEGS